MAAGTLWDSELSMATPTHKQATYHAPPGYLLRHFYHFPRGESGSSDRVALSICQWRCRSCQLGNSTWQIVGDIACNHASLHASGLGPKNASSPVHMDAQKRS